jgi:hypothetical protein
VKDEVRCILGRKFKNSYTVTFELTDNFILPFDTEFPPPDMVPELSINFPSKVTTLHLFPYSYAHLVAVSKSGATKVFPTAKNKAGAIWKLAGVIKSNNRGAFSGVSTTRS